MRGTAIAKVSVALGTHNGARHLGDQLESILRQTHRVTEIVLSDDASTDETVELAGRVLAEPPTDAVTPRLVVLRTGSTGGSTRSCAASPTSRPPPPRKRRRTRSGRSG